MYGTEIKNLKKRLDNNDRIYIFNKHYDIVNAQEGEFPGEENTPVNIFNERHLSLGEGGAKEFKGKNGLSQNGQGLRTFTKRR